MKGPVSDPESSKLKGTPLHRLVLNLEGAAQSYGSAVNQLPGGSAAMRELARWDRARLELEEALLSSWRCFHCGDVFTREQDAREHFGDSLMALAGCQIKGSDGSLLGYIRELEAQLHRWQSETHPLLLAIAQLQGERHAAVQRAEEEGFARGARIQAPAETAMQMTDADA